MNNNKPLTTLGDALAAKGSGWRAEMRAAEVERRPPPSNASRPDRGYVEQPAERAPSPAPVPRRREETPVLTAPVALIRFKRSNESSLTQLVLEHSEEHEEAFPQQDTEPVAETPPPPPLPAPPVVELPELRMPEPPPPPSAPPTEAPMPKAKGQRIPRPLETQIEAVARALRYESDGDYGAKARAAREMGVHPSSMSNWFAKPDVVAAAKKKNKGESPVSREQTQLSRPSPPSNGAVSAPVSIPTSIRSGTRTFEVVTRELNEAIELVRALKRELRDMLTDAD